MIDYDPVVSSEMDVALTPPETQPLGFAQSGDRILAVACGLAVPVAAVTDYRCLALAFKRRKLP